MAQHLAALLMDKFRHMSKQTLPLAEIQKGIATDTGMDVGPAAGGEGPRPCLTTAPHLLAGRLLAQAIAAPGYHRVQPKQLGSLPWPQKPALDCPKVEVFPLSTPRHRRAARGAPVARARRLRALHAPQRHQHRVRARGLERRAPPARPAGRPVEATDRAAPTGALLRAAMRCRWPGQSKTLREGAHSHVYVCVERMREREREKEKEVRYLERCRCVLTWV